MGCFGSKSQESGGHDNVGPGGNAAKAQDEPAGQAQAQPAPKVHPAKAEATKTEPAARPEQNGAGNADVGAASGSEKAAAPDKAAEPGAPPGGAAAAEPEKPPVPAPTLTAVVTGAVDSGGVAEATWKDLAPGEEGDKDFCGIYKVSDASNKAFLHWTKLPPGQSEGTVTVEISRVGLVRGVEYELRLCRCSATGIRYTCLTRAALNLLF